jgi:hypothetical protein
VSAVRAGAALAALVAGPPLYTLVQAGGLDLVTALQRGAVVAAGCALGATAIARLVSAYEREGDRQRRLDAADQAIAEAEAVVHEGRAIPADEQAGPPR